MVLVTSTSAIGDGEDDFKAGNALHRKGDYIEAFLWGFGLHQVTTFAEVAGPLRLPQRAPAPDADD